LNGEIFYEDPDAQARLPCIVCGLCGCELYGLDRIYFVQGEPVCGRCMRYYAQEGLRPVYGKDYIETGGYRDEDEAVVGRVP